MSRYIPNRDWHREKMLREIGVASFDALLKPVPEEYRITADDMDLPAPVSELELQRELDGLAELNTGAGKACFIGGGAYDHFIPAAMDHILLRSEFYTAYTPYQAEVSQGTLQAIFEYQTMIARLTGMEMANASVYDGGSAVAEACLMAMRATRRNRILLAGSLNPRWATVTRTYLRRDEFDINEVPFDADGRLDMDAAAGLMAGETAALVVQYPDYFGNVQDLEPLAELVHGAGGLLIVAADPVALAMLRSPGSAGADIVVGEGQSMGIPLSYGGPYAGFMASRDSLARKMPGRIIGRTVDRAGQTGYVMTLQTREQHIRREKATSNICTNQALMALANTIYLSLMGESGFREVARQCYHRSHYLYSGLTDIPGVEPVFPVTPFFREFTVKFPVPSNVLFDGLAGKGILAGHPLPFLGEGVMLVTATEKNSKEQMDAYIEAAARSCGECRESAEVTG